jgi:hypothetical protein
VVKIPANMQKYHLPLQYYFSFTIFEAMKANNPKIKPDIKPITGPVINIIKRGESGIGIVVNISASLGWLENRYQTIKYESM